MMMLVPLFALLSACATAYQSGGLTGGYYDSPGPGPLTKVVFSGNGYIQPETVQKYALHRSAELAKENKKPYFLLYPSLAAAAAGQPSEYPTVGSVGGKPAAFGFILFLSEQQPGAIETEKTLKEIGEFIRSNQPNSDAGGRT